MRPPGLLPVGRCSPEYGPVRLLLLHSVDDTGEQPEGLGTCGEHARLEEAAPVLGLVG